MGNDICVFEYLYRDASNYKAWGELFLNGTANDAAVARIRQCLEADVFFIPESVGIPSLREQLYQYSGGPTSDDHCYHEFVCLRPAAPSDNAPIFGSLDELIGRFKRASS